MEACGRIDAGAERSNAFNSSISPAARHRARSRRRPAYRAVGAARPRHRADVAHKRVPAKRGFHAVELDARPANLDLPVLAADPLEQAVGPLANEGRRCGRFADPRPPPFDARRREDARRPTVPTSRRGWRRSARRSRRARVARPARRPRRGGCRAADSRWECGRPRLLQAVVDEPLHHRRFGGGVDQLDRGVRREPRAHQVDVAPQRRVAADPDQPKRASARRSPSRDNRSQQRRKREQDGDGLASGSRPRSRARRRVADRGGECWRLRAARSGRPARRRWCRARPASGIGPPC